MQVMMLNDLRPPAGSRKKKKRVGRGSGSGHGGTSCRGHKGQNARSGGGVPPWFEGGQMPLQRRLPKRGFTNIFRSEYCIINVGDLTRFAEQQEIISPEFLKKNGHVKKMKSGLKVLGKGEITAPVHVQAHKFSKKAVEKIEKAGGKAEVLEQ
jgi:large subunit ribosomal protein L15